MLKSVTLDDYNFAKKLYKMNDVDIVEISIDNMVETYNSSNESDDELASDSSSDDSDDSGDSSVSVSVSNDSEEDSSSEDGDDNDEAHFNMYIIANNCDNVIKLGKKFGAPMVSSEEFVPGGIKEYDDMYLLRNNWDILLDKIDINGLVESGNLQLRIMLGWIVEKHTCSLESWKTVLDDVRDQRSWDSILIGRLTSMVDELEQENE